MTKFKIGDWIIHDNCKTPSACKILNIAKTHYQTKDSVNSSYLVLGFSIGDKYLRLATKEEIQKEIKFITKTDILALMLLSVRGSNNYNSFEEINANNEEILKKYVNYNLEL